MRRRLLVMSLLALPLFGAAPAAAAVTPLGQVCVERDGARDCSGSEATRVPSFDGDALLDVNVALPPAGDANLPLIVMHHGYGGKKYGYDELEEQLGMMRDFARQGYAVLAYSARGFAGSCGSLQARLSGGPACARGWIHLDDARREARDTQHLAGLLVDQGIVDPQRIGTMGNSYGGITSIQLAAMRDRMFAAGSDDPATPADETMQPGDQLVPFTSPNGTPMRIAAATPSIPGSDLAYALVPNGRTFDYVITKREDDVTPIGVVKQSFVAGLYATGQASNGYYAPPLVDPTADITSWFARLNAGEPYDNDPNVNPTAVYAADQISRFHSGYNLDASVPPAPMSIANGWTDDLFPVDEALRMYNRTRKQHPSVPLSLFFHDFGHQRGVGTGKAADKDAVLARQRERFQQWMDAYVKGDGAAPQQGVETRTQTCPKEALSGPTFTAPTWDAIHPGEIRFPAAPALSFTGQGSDPTVAAAVDPVGGGGDPCRTTTGRDQPNTATYRLPKVVGGGYTLMGAPTVIAKLTKVDAQNAQVNARLWDVLPNGDQRLVARTVYRPVGDGRPEPFQLHGNGYRFEPGHTPKLELLGADAPYARPSNGTFSITVRDLELRLPVAESPDCGQVLSHAAPVLPPYNGDLAPDVSATGTGACRTGRSLGAPGDFGSAGGVPLGPGGRPATAAQRRAVRLTLRTRCVRRGRSKSFRVRARVGGRDARRVRRVRFFVAGRKRAVDGRPPFLATVAPRRSARKAPGLLARVTLKDGRTVLKRAALRRCGAPARRS